MSKELLLKSASMLRSMDTELTETNAKNAQFEKLAAAQATAKRMVELGQINTAEEFLAKVEELRGEDNLAAVNAALDHNLGIPKTAGLDIGSIYKPAEDVGTDKGDDKPLTDFFLQL